MTNKNVYITPIGQMIPVLHNSKRSFPMEISDYMKFIGLGIVLCILCTILMLPALLAGVMR